MHRLQKYIIPVLLGGAGIIFFVALAQFAQRYNDVLQSITAQAGLWGVLSYIAITIASIVVAPLGTGFLIPVAANSFGPFYAAVYSIVGWFSGSLISFMLARNFGRRFVKDTTFVRHIQALEHKLSPLHLGIMLIALRAALPVDLMSYALGFASGVSLYVFAVTTLLGITPFAFLFAYASTASVYVQVSISLLGLVVFASGMYYVKKQI